MTSCRSRSLAELARQSEASLQDMLDGWRRRTATAPPALADVGSRRPLARLGADPQSARLQRSAAAAGRSRFRSRAGRRRPRASTTKSIDHDGERTAADRTLARRLGLLHRFQASVIDGNFHALAKRWDRAGAPHTAARRIFHRLAEDLGAARPRGRQRRRRARRRHRYRVPAAEGDPARRRSAARRAAPSHHVRRLTRPYRLESDTDGAGRQVDSAPGARRRRAAGPRCG